MYLLLVESQSKCGKIESYLGENYKCIATSGHLRKLDKINNKNFTCSYKNINNKKIKQMRSIIERYDTVIIATDDDREGESIGWHICELFGLDVKTTDRIIFREITREAISKALEHPIRLRMDIVEAQKSRMILDYNVGFSVSPVLWKYINKYKLSAGRCQTPALRLIYDNKVEIDAQKQTTVFKTSTLVQRVKFDLDKTMDEDEEIKEFLSESKVFQHTYLRTAEKKAEKFSPKPFITSTLQQTASNKYNFSPKYTITMAQKLYQDGHISYIRTDNYNLSNEFGIIVNKYIQTKYGKSYLGNSKYISSASEKHAHECIRPTNINVSDLPVKKYSQQERKVYKLIWKNTIQSCMSNASGLQFVGKISAPQHSCYKHRFEKMTFLGFLKLEDTTVEGFYDTFLRIKEGHINLSNIKSECSIEHKKHHYTEAKLVSTLERLGIGRPSTYAMIIDKIKEKGYVEKITIDGFEVECTDYMLERNEIIAATTMKRFGHEKNKLVITHLGILVIEFCIENFNDLFNYEYTEKMESRLDGVAIGKEKRNGICQDSLDLIHREIQQISSDKKPRSNEISLGGNKYYVLGKYGPCIKEKIRGETDTFYPIKKGLTFDDILENKDNISNVIEKKTENKSCIREINDDISIRKGKYGPYLFYKPEHCSKPRFFNLKKSKLDVYSTDEEIYDFIEQQSI
jgi:DNA topoisomerase-1